MTQEVNTDLDRTSQEIITNLPRHCDFQQHAACSQFTISVMRSVDVITQEVGSLRDRMASVKGEIVDVEKVVAHPSTSIAFTVLRQNTSACMATLVAMDEVKARMEATSAALQEADNWTSLADSASF